jgi:hypothetical protein
MQIKARLAFTDRIVKVRVRPGTMTHREALAFTHAEGKTVVGSVQFHQNGENTFLPGGRNSALLYKKAA